MRSDDQIVRAVIGDYGPISLLYSENRSRMPFCFYAVDLPQAYRGLPKRWYFLMVREQKASYSTHETTNTLRVLLNESLKDEMPIVVVSDHSGVRLKQENLSPDRPVFFVDKIDLPERHGNGDISDQPLITAIKSKFKGLYALKTLSPYTPNQPAVDWRFFGRKKELRDILDGKGNFFVIGARRIGKTSLLQEVQRCMKERDEIVHWVPSQNAHDIQGVVNAIANISAKDAYRAMRISQSISANYLATIIRRIKAGNKRLVLIFDELGNVLSKSGRDDWNFMGTLRELSHNEGVRIIISAFQEIFLKQQQDFNGPFVNFGTVIRLHPFNRNEIEEMIINPLSLWARVSDKRSLHETIRKRIGNHPLILQILGDYLFEKIFDNENSDIEIQIQILLTGPDLKIFENAVQEVFFDIELHIDKYVFLRLCKTIDTSQHIRQSDIELILSSQHIPSTLDQRNNLLDRLCMRGLLDRNENNYSAYMLDAPVLHQYIKNYYEIDDLCSDYLAAIHREKSIA